MNKIKKSAPGSWGLIANEFHVPAGVGRPDKVLGLFASEEEAWAAAEGCGGCECGGPRPCHADDSVDVREAIAAARRS